MWSKCTKFDIKKTEKVQFYATIINTGFLAIASRNPLYLETGWEPLSMNITLSTMFKIQTNHVPSYVKDITSVTFY